MKTQREKFEEWCNSNHTFKNPEWLDNEQCYNYTSTQMMWRAWQAAIDSVVVEFPAFAGWEPCRTDSEINNAAGYDATLNDVIKSLNDAGIKHA